MTALRRLLVLAVLAAAAWWMFDWAQEEDRQAALQPAVAGPLFPGLEVDAVTGFHLTLDQGHDLELEREPGGRWRIVEPTEEWARGDLVAQWLDNVARATYEPLDEDAARLRAADLGLEPPRHQFTLRLIDGREQTLLIGDVDPLGRWVYARAKGHDEIGLVTRNVVTLAGFHGEEWVDPDLLRGIEGLITRVKVVKPSGLLLDAVVEGGRWTLRGPQAVLPDGDRLTKMLRSLQFLRTERVLASRPTPEELAAFGFVTDDRVAAGDYGECTYLEVGNDAEGTVWALLAPGWDRLPDYVAAKRGDGDKVISVQAGALAMLRNEPEFFRDHRLLPPIRERATSLRIERGGQVLLDVRQGAKGLWSFHAPPRLVGTPMENERRLGRSALTDLMGWIDTVPVVGFVDDPDALPATGPGADRLVVGWQQGGLARSDQVTVGAPLDDGRLVAVSSLRPAEGLLVEPELLALFDPLQADKLRSVEPLAVDEARWRGLRLEHDEYDGPKALTRDAGGSWQGDDGQGRLYGLAHDLRRGLRGFHWEAARPDAVYAGTVTFLDEAGAPLARLRLRRPAPDEPDQAMGVPAIRIAVDGYDGLELVTPELWLQRLEELAP